METLLGSLFDELDGLDRSVCVLAFKWGMDDEEIGEIFSVDASIVNSIRSKAQAIVKLKITKEETVACTLQ